MRVIIYGAGAIGGVVGGHLARTGHEVALICRPAQAEAIRKQGLRLVTPGGTHILRLPAVTNPDQIRFKRDDVVFLCVKGQNTEEAMRDLRAVVEDVPVFCFQNGVRNEEIIKRYFPRVYGVMMRLSAAYITDGEVIARWEPPGWLILGRYPTGTDQLVETVAADLRAAGFYTLVNDDVMPHKWGKLMINLSNAINAITDDVSEKELTQAVRQEAKEILDKARINWIPREQLSQEWAEFRIPPRKSLDILPDRSSTWLSLARQQGTVETDFLNGEIVRLAARLGMKAPLNEALIRITEEMAVKREKPGKYTAAELRARLGLA